MKRVITILIFLCVWPFSGANTQDIHFSQFWMTPLLQNPALAGANHDLKAVINYKNQWSSVASAYKTFNVSYDMKLNTKKTTSGFWAGGINVFSDKAGDANMGTTLANLNFAYHARLSEESTLGAGIMGGFIQRSIDFSQLQWLNQFDGISYNAALSSGEPAGVNSFTRLDLGAGISWTYTRGEMYMTGNDHINAHAGLAVFHPHQPKYSFYNLAEKQYLKMVANANMLYGIKNTRLSLMPGFNFYWQGPATELVLGSLFKYRIAESSKYTGFIKGSAFSLGLHYRNKDAMITSFMLEMGQFAMGVSYDINVSALKTASAGKGGMELSLRFINPNPFLYKTSARFY